MKAPGIQLIIVGFLLSSCSAPTSSLTPTEIPALDGGPTLQEPEGGPSLELGVIATDPNDPRNWSHERLMEGAKLRTLSWSNNIRVLTLKGKPYQLGYQHGFLLKDKLQAFMDDVHKSMIWNAALTIAVNFGPEGFGTDRSYLVYAEKNSLPRFKEECQGMVAGSSGAISYDECVMLNSLLYILEDLLPRYAPQAGQLLACTQFIAREKATLEGTLIHGRNLDWLAIEALLQNPLLIVRHPEQGLRHVIVAWPGMIGTLTGINEAGLSIGANENNCLEAYRDMTGVPPMQQMTQLLTEAHDLEEATTMIQQTDHAACQLYVISHGPTHQGAVFELTAAGVGIKNMDERDVLFAANHFAYTEVRDYQTASNLEDLESNTVTRFTRLRERLTGESLPPHQGLSPEDPDYAFGKVDVPVAIDLLRDPVDLRPESNRYSYPCTEFEDGNWAVGNNHNIHSVVMVPEKQQIWVATGWDKECRNPIYNPYIGFDLQELFAGEPSEGQLPVYDPPYNGSYGNGIYEDE